MTAIRYRDGTTQYFHHDARMRMYAMEDGGETTYYTWDENGLNLLTERDASGAVTAEYTHGHSPVDGAGTTVAARKQVGACAYYQYPGGNGHHDVVTISNAAGVVTHRYTCNAWGELVHEQVTEPAAPNSLIWQANWLYLKEGVYKSPARLYLADVGRFLQRDPLGNPSPGLGRATSSAPLTADADPSDRTVASYVYTSATPHNGRLTGLRVSHPHLAYQRTLDAILGQTLPCRSAVQRPSFYRYGYNAPTCYLDPDGRAVGLGAGVVIAFIVYQGTRMIALGYYEVQELKAHDRACECLKRGLDRLGIDPIQEVINQVNSGPGDVRKILACRWLIDCTEIQALRPVAGLTETAYKECKGTLGAGQPVTGEEDVVVDLALGASQAAADRAAAAGHNRATTKTRACRVHVNMDTVRGKHYDPGHKIEFCQEYRASD